MKIGKWKKGKNWTIINMILESVDDEYKKKIVEQFHNQQHHSHMSNVPEHYNNMIIGIVSQNRISNAIAIYNLSENMCVCVWVW